MIYPSVYPELGIATAPGQEEVGPGEDIPSRSATKAPADIPIRTAYFFNRWMWIQFPYIALGNSYERFYDGIEKARIIAEATGRGTQELPNIDGIKKERPFFKKSFFKDGMSLSKSMPLPEVSFVRKAARSFPRATAASSAEFDAAAQFEQRLINLQDSIRNLKEEYDFLCQQKNTMDKQLYQMKGTLVELVRAGESTSQFDGSYAEVSKREQIATEKYHKTAKFHANLANLYMICERHPPHMPALIIEVENKLDQDADITAMVVGILALVMAILALVRQKSFESRQNVQHKLTRTQIKAENEKTRKQIQGNNSMPVLVGKQLPIAVAVEDGKLHL